MKFRKNLVAALLVGTGACAYAQAPNAPVYAPSGAQVADASLQGIPAQGAIKGVRKGADYSNIAGQADSALADAKAASMSRNGSVIKMNNNTKIAVAPGVNEFIPIARNHPNRIVTPFHNPEIVSTSLTGGSAKSGQCGEICVKGNVIYVSTDQTEPASMFITEQGSEAMAISITLVPKNIPPREVFIDFSSSARVNTGSTVPAEKEANYQAESFERSLPYVDTIRTMMRTVALGKIPSGYNLGNITGARNLPRCKQDGLVFDFSKGQRLSGHNMDLFVGVVKNKTKNRIEFNEMSCGTWQTAAVATWPLHVLGPGQATELYVIMKEEREVIPEPERPYLLKRDYLTK
jgi:conjugal transfer pilus assembly protein TraK